MNIKTIEADVSIQSGIDGAVSIANYLVESETQIGREVIKTVYEEPVLESLEVVANGTYEPEEGVDGYSDVTVNVPDRIPVLEQLNAIANGSYFPEEGVDGFDEVLVNVPNAPEKMVASGSFIATVKSTGCTFDTKNTDWTKLIIVPHSFPYSVAAPRSIAAKYIDMSYGDTGMGITAFASNSGATINAGGWHNVNVENGSIFVENGVVTIATGGNQASVGLFIKDVQYDWYAWSEDALEPEEPAIFQGRFMPTEAGVYAINTGYTGDSYPKSILICYLDDLFGSDFLEQAKRYAIHYFQARRINAVEPTYSGETTENGYRYDLTYRYTLTSYYTISPATIYITDGNDPEYGGKNCVKMPNKNTLKVFVEEDGSSSGKAAFFQTGFEYFYQVIY